jgi:hypothetical protein
LRFLRLLAAILLLLAQPLLRSDAIGDRQGIEVEDSLHLAVGDG